jgi:hypothetical protein
MDLESSHEGSRLATPLCSALDKKNVVGQQYSGMTRKTGMAKHNNIQACPKKVVLYDALMICIYPLISHNSDDDN